MTAAHWTIVHDHGSLHVRAIVKTAPELLSLINHLKTYLPSLEGKDVPDLPAIGSTGDDNRSDPGASDAGSNPTQTSGAADEASAGSAGKEE